MRNDSLIPFETIVLATRGKPEAVGEVMRHYRRSIHYAAFTDGQANRDAEDYIQEALLKAIFKYRFGCQDAREAKLQEK